MKNQIKYTSEGQKVKVLGQLNSTEYIVQEIFIVDGQEIPSGENFTTRSLHDSPRKSWKEKTLEDLEKRYDSEKKAYEKRLRQLDNQYNRQISEVIKKTEFLKRFVKSSSESTFNRLNDFLEGKIKYMVNLGWSPEITEFNLHESSFGGIKLITLFGQDKGSLDWRINTYSDGSGGNTTFIPCQTLDEAKQVLTDYLNDRDIIHSYGMKAVNKWNLTIKKELIDAFYEKQKKELQKKIEQHKASIKDLKLKVKSIK